MARKSRTIGRVLNDVRQLDRKMRKTVRPSEIDGATAKVVVLEAALACFGNGDGERVVRFDGAAKTEAAEGAL
jgi:hypothetical protein